MKRSSIALAIVAALGVSTSVQAEELEGWAAGFVEYYMADEDKFDFVPKDRNDFGIGAEIARRFSESWAARIEFTTMNLEAYEYQESIDGVRFGADVLFFPTQKNTYVFAGLKNQSLDETYTMANLGVGHHYKLDDKWTLFTELAAYHDFGDSYRDYSAKVGLAYHFGGNSSTASSTKSRSNDDDNDGVINSKDMCPNTPSGVAVNSTGCALDDDKDGVFNTYDQCPNTAPGRAVDSKGCDKDLDSDGDGVKDANDMCPNTPASDKTDAKGCTLFKTTEDTINLAVNFNNNSSDVVNPNNQDIKRFAEFMKKYPHVVAEIEGHTSATGSAAYNLKLSEKRADAIKAVLVENYGIDGDRIQTVGYGETRLLDTSNTAAAHNKNRRISARLVVENKEKVTH